MKTAIRLKDVSEHFTGEAELFALDPPLEGYSRVIVSATQGNKEFLLPWPETYIFAADQNGEVADWGELEGSFKGAMDIPKALANAGYTIIEEANK
jgi:hypothetical protein